MLYERGDVAVEVSGSLRQRAVFTRGTSTTQFNEAVADTLPATTCILASTFADCPAFHVVGGKDIWDSLTRLRLHIDFRLTRHLSGELVYDHELRLGTLRTVERGLTEGISGPSFLPFEDDIDELDFGGEADEGRWRQLLYRAYLAYETDRVEIIAGRQRIAWGVGRLWSPADRFNFIQPLAIEGDQTAGVDAVDFKLLFGGFNHIEAAYAVADDSENAAYAVRLHGLFNDADYSLIAGVFQEAITGGATVARNVGDAAVRLEAVYTDPERKVWPVGDPRPGELRGFWQIVASIDRSFDFGNGVYVLAEYLYNGNALGFGRGRAGGLLPLFEATDEAPPGLPGDIATALGGPFVTTTNADRLGGSQVVSRGRHQTGIQLGYDLMTFLRGDLVTLYDWEGHSAAVAPVLHYEPYQFLEITVGGQLFAGVKRSEYGQAEHLAFAIVEGFF